MPGKIQAWIFGIIDGCFRMAHTLQRLELLTNLLATHQSGSPGQLFLTVPFVDQQDELSVYIKYNCSVVLFLIPT